MAEAADGIAEGQAAFAFAQQLLTLLIRGQALTHQSAGALVLEWVALLKGAPSGCARTLLFDLPGHYGAKHQEKPLSDRKKSR